VGRDYARDLLAALEHSPRALCKSELFGRARISMANPDALAELNRLVREGRVRVAVLNGRQYYYVHDGQLVADVAKLGYRQRQVLALLALRGPMGAADVAKALRCPRVTSGKALASLARRGLVQAGAQGLYELTDLGRKVVQVFWPHGIPPALLG